MLIGGMVTKTRAKTFIYWLSKWVNKIRRSIFGTFEVIFRRLMLRLPRYRQKRLFATFDIRYTALDVIFLNIVGYFVSI